jgi:DeoR/GlpR family transcriptional regulator of sugar metabolism
MLAAMRQARILDEVRRAGGVRVSDLTGLLGVSDMTIRRDLEALDRRGLLAKVHGGATAIDTASAVEPGFEAKSLRETAEKEAIAARAATLVRPGMAIAVTAGTTTWTLARHLSLVADLTVVTNSLKVAEVLHAQNRPDLTVVLTGGLRTPSDGLVGPVAVQALNSLHVDMVIMGVHGLDARAGLTTPNLLEAETNRAMVDASKRLVVIADHTKWGVVGLSRIAPLSAISTLLIDDRLPADAIRTLEEQVDELVLIPTSGPGMTP